ncbi:MULTISPECIES: hypothetical protein [Streptomyces]|uniref:DUF7701 domain-containing protein n=1 Tax=Streptomyces TaxID=1883 RepID=UPI001D0B76F9|nr:hypothetical protein [Streptomyces longhuiensis]UDM03287.1 hypothetical protein LGI35_36015 [Streptomyces longhuiensis]
MTTYLTEAARLIRSLLPPTAEPPGDDESLFLGYAVLMRAKGTRTTASDVHDAWTAWMLSRGSDHRSLVPFEQLSGEVQALDAAYVHAIHAAAERCAGDARRG